MDYDEVVACSLFPQVIRGNALPSILSLGQAGFLDCRRCRRMRDGSRVPEHLTSLRKTFLLAVRHAVIDGYLRLVKRCGERISRYAAHDGRHEQAKRRRNIAA